jgi:hypothetical protein
MNGLHHALYVASLIALAGAVIACVTIRSHAAQPHAREQRIPRISAQVA